ncbi:hypothetical protein K4B79_44760 [Streptomyces lincolnensis]|uniref:hypothetical protein n=1 Tax=Streptomyces lincolnensis TaxID=1915 RepID=UPI001E29E7E3|nr:hypothetical protein [Streptomyces lincolnensis]MCD7445280.1 hypothetical protein [Streptomyces lincolnensis]
MPAPDPYQVHDYAVLSTILIAGAPALLGLLAYLGACLAPRRLRAHRPATALRDTGLLCAAAALAVYLWGCLHVVFLERQEIGNRCAQVAGGVRVAGFHGDFVPLRLVCRTDDGRDLTVVIPAYVNPSTAVLLLLALACAGAAALLARRARTASRKEPRP